MEAVLEQKNDLVLLIEQNQLEAETGKSLKEKFLPFFEQAQQWKEKAESLVITDVSQVREMKMAREARLALKDIRVGVEKTRKTLKEDSLRKGKAIDGIANVIKFLIEPIEEHLENQEKFAEIQEAKRKEALKQDRLSQLQPYNFQYENGFSLGEMSEDMFTNLLSGCKKAHEEKIEAERKAEEERIAQLKAEAEERERIRLENERLKKEAEEREAQMKAEREKAEAERKALDEKNRKEREAAEAEANRIRAEQEAAVKAEREKREKAEAELKAKQEAEDKAKREAAAKAEVEKKAQLLAEKKAAAAPDKAKLVAFATIVDQLQVPEVKGEEAKLIAESVKTLLAKLSTFITDKAATL